ncbi:MAG: UDP-glucose 4-epimerase [Gammaproteobacteria bacterium]|jgi:UDP-glucose 4-epimerase
MTALIAGGCGFIGLNIAEACLGAGEDVVLLDRNAPPTAAAKAFAALPGSWRHASVDITNEAQVAQAFSEQTVHEVYYGAAITSGPDRERESPEQVIGVNLLGLTHVIKAAAHANVRRMINISSGSAYGDGGFAQSGACAPLDEYSTRPLPSTLYSVTKLASEGVCRRMAELTSLDVLSVRLAVIFGPWELDSGFRDTLSAPMQAAAIALSGGHATVARRDSRDWTYSRDVAAALRALMAAPSHNYDLYHVSAGRTCSMLDWGAALAKHFPTFSCRLCTAGETPNVNLHGERDRLLMSPQRLATDIGHTVPNDIESTAANFAEWIKAHPTYWKR